MAVSEQTPYIEYVANGITTSFALEFDCDNRDHLIVLVDDVEPVVGSWSFSNGAVVFNTAPENGKKITIQRNTPFSRTTDYQSYNNSFRPPAVNSDFDRVWFKIQELGVKDWLLDLKIQKFRDDVNLTALENTLEEARQIRDDTANSVVEVQSNVAQSQTLLENTTAQANLAQGYASSANSANAAAQQAVIDVSTAEADVYSALSAQQIAVNNSLTAIAGGHKAYQTLAAAQAAQASLPANTVVEVTNDPTASNNGTYQWNGTTLTKSAYDPLTQAKGHTDAEFVKREQYSVSVNKKPYDFAIIDSKGQIGFYVLNGEDLFLKNLYVGGNIDVQALALKTLTVDTDLTLLGTQFFKGITKDFFTQVNDQGQVLSKIDQFGNAVFNDVNANTARIETLTVENLNYKAPVDPFTCKYQNVLILSEGQSLGKGIQGGVLSTAQKYNDKMFYGGCSIVTPKNTSLGQFSSFVPLVQASATSADGGLGEIPVQAATEMIHQILDDNAGNLVFVGASNAVGGQTIDYLSTTAFTSYVDPCINNALALSQVESKSIGIPAFLWTHGNASAGDAAYKTKLLALRQQYDSKAKSAFNQSEDVRCITYQYTNNSNPSVNKVTDAIYSILKEDTPNFTIACPDYHLPYSTDDVHLQAYGYKLLGAYYGLVYKKVVIDGEDWKPLYPISVFRQGKLVQIKFHVPHGNLVLDTNTDVINVLSNYGFDVVKSDLSPIAINDVKVVGSDTVVITCAEDVPSGSIVHYARKTTKSVVRQNTFSGFDFTVNNSAGLIAGGSLRDTQGEDIQFNINTDQLPVMYKLHNWCISFSETLA